MMLFFNYLQGVQEGLGGSWKGTGESWKGPVRVREGPGGSWKGPRMVLEGSWEGFGKPSEYQNYLKKLFSCQCQQ